MPSPGASDVASAVFVDGRRPADLVVALDRGRRARAQGVPLRFRLRGLDWRQQLLRACLAQALTSVDGHVDIRVALEEINHLGEQVSRTRRQLRLEGFSVRTRGVR